MSTNDNPFPMKFEVRDQEDDKLVSIMHIFDADEYTEQEEIADLLGFYLIQVRGDSNE